MKMASTIHSHAIRSPFNFDTNLLKSSPITCPKNVSLRLIPRRAYSLFSGGFGCAGKVGNGVRNGGRRSSYFSQIACGRGTEPQQEASTARNSEMEASRSHSSDGIKENYSLCNDEPNENEALYDDDDTIVSGVRAADNASPIRNVALCVFSAVAFGIGLGIKDGVGKASEFFAGYLLEQSLSIDNLFVFVLIFKYFKVPVSYQNRVLSYGFAGAVVFRLSLILLGSVTLERFEVVNVLLAMILLYSSFKLFAAEDEDTDLSDNFIIKTCQKFIPVTSNYDGNRFITIQDGVWKATPLLLTVAVIELSDIAFAVDSIPAVFGVTRDPFVVFTSNFFAILGLRSYYTLISESMADLEYLQPAIGVVLSFIGCKMILDFFGFHIPTEASLGFVALSLTTGVMLSLVRKSE